MDDGSKEQPHMTAGLDLGDKYSYLCLIDTQSGEVVEEGRMRTIPEALRRRFCSERVNVSKVVGSVFPLPRGHPS